MRYLLNNKDRHLYCQFTIVLVYNHSSHPSPAEANGHLCHGPGLVNITRDCSEDIRKVKPVTQTRAA